MSSKPRSMSELFAPEPRVLRTKTSSTNLPPTEGGEDGAAHSHSHQHGDDDAAHSHSHSHSHTHSDEADDGKAEGEQQNATHKEEGGEHSHAHGDHGHSHSHEHAGGSEAHGHSHSHAEQDEKGSTRSAAGKGKQEHDGHSHAHGHGGHEHSHGHGGGGGGGHEHSHGHSDVEIETPTKRGAPVSRSLSSFSIARLGTAPPQSDTDNPLLEVLVNTPTNPFEAPAPRLEEFVCDASGDEEAMSGGGSAKRLDFGEKEPSAAALMKIVEAQQEELAALRSELGQVRAVQNGLVQFVKLQSLRLRVWSWRSASYRLSSLRAAHSDFVTSCVVNPEGTMVATAGLDRLIVVWDTRTLRPTKILRGHEEPIYALSCSKDGRYLVSGGADKTVRVWLFETGESVASLRGHKASVYGLWISNKGADGRVTVFSGSGDRTVHHWRLDPEVAYSSSINERAYEVVRKFTGHTGPVSRVLFLHGKLYTASYDSTLRVWDVESGKVLRAVKAHEAALGALTHCAGFLFTGGNDNVIKMWDVDTLEEIRRFDGHADWIMDLAVDEDSTLFSASRDRTVRLWSVATGEQVRVLNEMTDRSRLSVKTPHIAESPSKRTQSQVGIPLSIALRRNGLVSASGSRVVIRKFNIT